MMLCSVASGAVAGAKATFEHGDSLVEVPFAEGQQSRTEARMDNAGWLLD
jgi:hypothetical protein